MQSFLLSARAWSFFSTTQNFCSGGFGKFCQPFHLFFHESLFDLSLHCIWSLSSTVSWRKGIVTFSWHGIVYILTVMGTWLHMGRAESFATLTALAIISPLNLCLTTLSETDAILLNYFVKVSHIVFIIFLSCLLLLRLFLLLFLLAICCSGSCCTWPIRITLRLFPSHLSFSFSRHWYGRRICWDWGNNLSLLFRLSIEWIDIHGVAAD